MVAQRGIIGRDQWPELRDAIISPVLRNTVLVSASGHFLYLVRGCHVMIFNLSLSLSLSFSLSLSGIDKLGVYH